MTTVIAEMTRGEFELTRGLEVLSAVQFRNSRISSREDVKKYEFGTSSVLLIHYVVGIVRNK